MFSDTMKRSILIFLFIFSLEEGFSQSEKIQIGLGYYQSYKDKPGIGLSIKKNFNRHNLSIIISYFDKVSNSELLEKEKIEIGNFREYDSKTLDPFIFGLNYGYQLYSKNKYMLYSSLQFNYYQKNLGYFKNYLNPEIPDYFFVSRINSYAVLPGYTLIYSINDIIDFEINQNVGVRNVKFVQAPKKNYYTTFDGFFKIGINLKL